MKRLVLVVAVGACVTPYQPMGFTGGVQAKRVAPGAFIITVKVNSYTSAETAFEYAHRAAREACPEGYDLADSSTSSTDHYVRIGDTVSNHPKSGISLAIQCRATAPTVAVAASRLKPQVPAPDCQRVTKLVPAEAVVVHVPDGVSTPGVLNAIAQTLVIGGLAVAERDDLAGTMVSRPFTGQTILSACNVNEYRVNTLRFVVTKSLVTAILGCRYSFGWEADATFATNRGELKDCEPPMRAPPGDAALARTVVEAAVESAKLDAASP